LLVLITGDSPRDVREMTPEGAAVLTSRTVRDWTDKACEPGGFLIAPKTVAAADARFAPLVQKAADGRVSLVAKMPDKEPIVLDPVPSYDVVLSKLSEYAGVKADVKVANPTLKVPEFSEEQWAQFIGKNGVAEFGGEKRYLSAKPRDLKQHPYGASLADAGVRIIPRSEWPARLAALKAANAGILPILYDRLPCSDQASTNYCWANGPANCGATILYITGRGSYLLSAASIAGPITGYRNVGGWPKDAIDFMARKGAVRDSLWPNAAINSAYYNRADVQADYPKHLVSSVIADLGQTGPIFDETVTCVLLGCPVATSHDWWGHAVMAVGLDYVDGTWYLIERNSWGMSFGDQGFFKLREGFGRNQAGPDDAQVILWLGRTAQSVNVPASVEIINPACPTGQCPTSVRQPIFGRRR